MPVSGLVLTLAPPGPDAERAVSWMREDARFAVGEPEPATPRRLPVALDTPDRAADKAAWQQMQDHPGIDFVDVTCVFFEEDQAPPTATPTPNTCSDPTPVRSQPW